MPDFVRPPALPCLATRLDCHPRNRETGAVRPHRRMRPAAVLFPRPLEEVMRISDSSGQAATVASMQFQARPDDAVDMTYDDQCRALNPAVNCNQVHAIQRHVEEPGQPAFDGQLSADQIAHQRSHRREAAE